MPRPTKIQPVFRVPGLANSSIRIPLNIAITELAAGMSRHQ